MELYEAPTFQLHGAAPAHFKGRSRWSFRASEQVTALCLHQTAVAGGFGARDFASRMQRYGGTSMARRGTPYHYVYSPQDCAVVAVWHPRFYSYHGNGANAYSVGVAFDGKYPGDRLAPELVGEALRLIVEHLKSIDYTDVAYLEAHRQHSGARAGDPGALIWAAAEEQAERMHIYPRPDLTTKAMRGGQGRPIPDEWRPATRQS